MQLDLFDGKERQVNPHEETQGQETWVAPFISIPRPVINHIGVSGGKDSTALLLWALHESRYSKESLDFTFCDTDNEHEWTYDQIVMLSEHSVANGGPKIKWLRSPLGFFQLAKHKKRFPSAMARFCTQVLKTLPTKEHVEKLVNNGNEVVMHSGVRASESRERAKLVKREAVRVNVSELRPLLHWSLDDVWAIHKRHGIKRNPLYDLGQLRVGCVLCVMNRKAGVANVATNFPEFIERVRGHEGPWFEGDIYHTFFARDKIPKRFHSISTTTKNGKEFTVCTIDDVVRWAKENPNGRGATGKPKELDTSAEDRTSCQSTWGSCE